MSTTIEEIERHLKQLDLAYGELENGALALSWDVDQFRDVDGDDDLWTVIRPMEGGELISMHVPFAYRLTNTQVAPALAVCAMITARVALVRYAYLEAEQCIVPTIHLSLEDGTLTTEQLRRCLYTLVNVVDRYHDVIRLAIEEGRVDPELVDNPALCRPADDLRDLLDLLPAEVLLEAADRARARQA